MIVPEICFKEDIGPQSLLENVRHWSLTGKVLISGAGEEDVAMLENILERAAGSVDIFIELATPTERDALALLNAGASVIVCDSVFDLIPSDRIRPIVGEEASGVSDSGMSPAMVRPAELDSAELLRLDSSGSDIIVSSSRLESEPELLAKFFRQRLTSDRPDGLWPTVIVDPIGTALGLAYSNYESLLNSIATREATYWSRSRDELWIKGRTSGATQELLNIRFDCDGDCLRFQVIQQPPGFCHRKTYTCFGQERTIQTVIQRLAERIESADAASYTKKLATNPQLLRSKLIEEAGELAEADSLHETAWEAADVLYFSLVAMIERGVALEDVFHELARRMNRVVRRTEKPKPE
ncbi:MAG: phosphoribosyl-ATP diphosphatase [Planctomycetota bacterium]